jgi:PAS domain-containing protein
MSFTPYAAVLWASSAISLVVALRRRSPARGGSAFALMMYAVVFWTLMSGFGAAAAGMALKVLFGKLGYICAACVAPLFLVFAIQHSGGGGLRSPLRMAVLWIIPVASIILAATNELHRLVWSRQVPSSFAGGEVIFTSYGPWYWVSVVFFAAADLLGAIILVRAVLPTQRLFRLQTTVLLLALTVPWAGEALGDVFNLFPGLDLPAVGFAVSGALLILGLSRFRLLDIMPIARAHLVERMGDGLLVLDGKNRIVDANPAAQRIFDIGPAALGRPVEEVSTLLGRILPQAAGKEDFRTEGVISSDPQKHFDLHISALSDRLGSLEGRVVVLRDVTARTHAERDRERLILELRSALADIKVLRGLLPICVGCKKIRDDRGNWKNLEEFVEERSDAQFSHGLCEECMSRLYPEYLP